MDDIIIETGSSSKTPESSIDSSIASSISSSSYEDIHNIKTESNQKYHITILPPSRANLVKESFDNHCLAITSEEHLEISLPEIQENENTPDEILAASSDTCIINSKTCIKRLILEGGGVRGIAFIGGLRALYDEQILNSVNQIAGSSVGGLIAILIAVGYSIDEMEDIFKEMDFVKLKDDKFGIFRDTKRLIKKFGLYRGEYLKKMMRKFIFRKMNTRYCSFKYLFDEKNIELLLTGTNVNYRKVEYFHYKTTPDMDIVDALRITASMPFLYKAVEYNGCMYVDGGMACNYPFKSFWELQGNKGDPDVTYINETLGMRVESKNEILEHDGIPVKYPTDNIISFSEGLIETMFNIIDKRNVNPEIMKHTILIMTNINSLKFDLTSDEKKSLYTSGYETTFNFIRNIK